MQIVAEQIRLVRLRRNLSVAQIVERASCSPPYGFTYRERDTDSSNRHLS